MPSQENWEEVTLHQSFARSVKAGYSTTKVPAGNLWMDLTSVIVDLSSASEHFRIQREIMYLADSD